MEKERDYKAYRITRHRIEDGVIKLRVPAEVGKPEIVAGVLSLIGEHDLRDFMKRNGQGGKIEYHYGRDHISLRKHSILNEVFRVLEEEGMNGLRAIIPKHPAHNVDEANKAVERYWPELQ